MVDYLIVGAALTLAVFILARQMLRIGRGGGCGCEGGGAGVARLRSRRSRKRMRDTARYPHALTLHVSGMHCETCAHRIEDALQTIDGIVAQAELPDTVLIRSKHPLDKATCAAAIRAAGYEVIEG